MQTQMVKWGNSLAVRIPKVVLEEAKLKEGDALEIEVVEGRVELRRPTKIPTLKPALFSQDASTLKHPRRPKFINQRRFATSEVGPSKLAFPTDLTSFKFEHRTSPVLIQFFFFHNCRGKSTDKERPAFWAVDETRKSSLAFCSLLIQFRIQTWPVRQRRKRGRSQSSSHLAQMC